MQYGNNIGESGTIPTGISTRSGINEHTQELAGNDILYGYGGNDILDGGELLATYNQK